jgi:PKD repeat protein
MCQDNVPVLISPDLHRIAMAVFERAGSFGGSLGFKDKDGNFITDADRDWLFLGREPSGLVLPRAKLTTDVSSGPEPLTVQFDGSASSSPGGSITKHFWQFGDGGTAEGAKVTHTYQKGSFYTPRLFVTNNVSGTDSTEQTISVTLSPENVAPWASADIGLPVLPGGERRDGACLAVFAGGTAISETSDQFHFTYVEKTGDAVLTAKVAEALWKPGAVAGIMFRESLAPDSRFAFMNIQFFSGVGGVQYGLMSRKTPGARALASRGNTALFTDQGYLRLERKGNEFIAFTSPDGKTWTQLYSTIFSSASETMLAGFAVAAGDAAALDAVASRQSARITYCNIDFGDIGPIGALFHRGDSDDNGQLQLTDAVRILGYLFLGQAAPTCLEAADSDNNGQLQLTDAVRILGYLFLGQAAPAPPGPPPAQCGPDPPGTRDLGCAAYTHC